MDFYSPQCQAVAGPVVLLPQKGSVSGGSKRPMNSWAIVRERDSILVDAPLSWTMNGVRALAKRGKPPKAMVLTHRDLAGSGDAWHEFADAFDAPFLMHPDDQAEDAPGRLDVPLHDPAGSAALDEAGVRVIHVPGHSPGSIMLHVEDDGGVLLCGDSAVGPGPEQADRTPRLQRPLGADRDERFERVWKETIRTLPVAAILPLHGAPLLRDERADFDELVAGIWTGQPMDPRSP